MRGVIPALVLAEIERRADAPISKLFDLVGGTSTGGILALGLVKPAPDGSPAFAASELVDLYAREGETIFHDSIGWKVRSLGGLFEERYSEQPIERLLRDRYFGDTRLSEALCELVVTAYDVDRSCPLFFKRGKARRDSSRDFPMWWAARATSAAPTYFEPFGLPPEATSDQRVLVDGGVYANNPALCAYVEALDLFGADAEIHVCSLGTGQRPARRLSKRQVDRWGAANWATTILDMTFDGVADTVDHQLKLLCRHGEDGHPRYTRFQVELPAQMSAALDNATPEQVERLEALGRKLIAERAGDLDALCERLTADRAAV
jgi:patatin-like phospholipase/acyl hydrolase